jgi:endonuclease/exonuclease/phosphatase family metal-dependent hydrolase
MGDRRLWRVGLLGAATMVALLVAGGPTRAETMRADASAGPLDGTPQCGEEAPAGDAAPVADDGALRVATCNVLHSETDDGDLSLGDRLPLLADAIAGSGADIVGSQEVTRNLTFDPAAEAPQRHGLVAQRLAQAIAARTGQPWGWCWSLSNPHVPLSPDVYPGGGNPLDAAAAANGNTPDPGDFSEGLAILTRFPIEASAFRRLTPRSYEAVGCVDLDPFCPLDALFDSRQVLWARVRTPGGGVDMFTTHLAHTLTDLSDTTRKLQADQALAITSEWATPDDLPDFLVGDFNSVPDSDVIAAAADAGFVDTYDAAGGVACTATGAPGCSGGPPAGAEDYTSAPVRTMSERIDYVLARPPSACTLSVPSSEVIGDEPSEQADGRWGWPSDHVGFASTISCAAATPSAVAGASPEAPSAPTATDGRLPATGGADHLVWAGFLVLAGLAAGAAAARHRRADPPGW